MNEPIAIVVGMTMTSITKTPVEQLAEELSMSSYPFHLTSRQQRFAQDNGLVIVTGHSDDLMLLSGAFYDEVGAYDGGTALVDAAGVLPDRENIDEDDELQAYFARKPKARTIEALWCDEVFSAATWAFRTDIPHICFDIMEDDEPYCRAIIFAVADLK